MKAREQVERALRDGNLPSPARWTAFALLSFGTDGAAVIPAEDSPSLNELARATALGKSTVQRALSTLEDSGWVVRSRPDAAKARRGERTSYEFTVPGIGIHYEPDPDCPDSGGPAADLPPSSGSPTAGSPKSDMTGSGGPAAGLPRNQRGKAGPTGGPAKSRQNGTHAGSGRPGGRPATGPHDQEERRSTSKSSPPAIALLQAMLGVDAAEAGEIVAAVLAERAPRDLVSYLRHLVRNGDIAKWRIRPTAPAAAGPTHGYLDPADDGYCHHPGCGLPPQSPRHAPTDHGRN